MSRFDDEEKRDAGGDTAGPSPRREGKRPVGKKPGKATGGPREPRKSFGKPAARGAGPGAGPKAGGPGRPGGKPPRKFGGPGKGPGRPEGGPDGRPGFKPGGKPGLKTGPNPGGKPGFRPGFKKAGRPGARPAAGAQPGKRVDIPLAGGGEHPEGKPLAGRPSFGGKPGFKREGQAFGKPGFKREGQAFGKPGFKREGQAFGKPGFKREGPEANEAGVRRVGTPVGKPGVKRVDIPVREDGFRPPARQFDRPAREPGFRQAGGGGFRRRDGDQAGPGQRPVRAYARPAVRPRVEEPPAAPTDPLSIAKQAWQPTLKWSAKEVRNATYTEASVKTAVQAFHAGVQAVMAATTAEEFYQAQRAAAATVDQHQFLRWAPLPRPLPTIPENR